VENVVVLTATNRPDTLDPALLRPDRLGDDIIMVPRPNRKAAASIFSKYLHDDIPLDGAAGRNGERPHMALIDSVLAKMYSANGEGTLATLTFRDGSRKPLRAADLVSGAVISKIVNDAAERACLREIETEQRGLRLGDLLSAVDNEFERVLRFLTPRNIGAHIELPQDMDVVRIDPVERKVRRPHLYLRVS
jgi:SpoVK/Ycf46/Vps4 family AAA+-type ATPase